MSGNRDKINSVFYAETYHPIQAGSIDGTDILPHDNAVYRAHLCSLAGLYDPFGDPKVDGDPYCTVFVGHLSHLTTEETLHKAMSKFGKVKKLRLVRNIVTGASRGYAFVEYESEREMRRAYEDAHHSIVDDSEIIVDYSRQQLMPGWIPRRLGGGLGGKKESGQLRFGGRERPFRAPLRPIPFDELKKLGIPPPPEGRYMSRYQVPSPPRRSSLDKEDQSHKKDVKRKHSHRHGRSTSHDRSSDHRNYMDRVKSSLDREDWSHKKDEQRKHSHRHGRRSTSRDHLSDGRNSTDEENYSYKRHKHGKHSYRYDSRSSSRDGSSDARL